LEIYVKGGKMWGMEEIRRAIAKSVFRLFDFKVEPVVVDGGEHADYASNIAMALAGKVGRSPVEVAEELVADMKASEGVECEVAGRGFINFTLGASTLWRELDEKWSEKYGENTDGAGKTAVVEFPSQNMAKPYSVGHLRPGNQGWAAKRLLEMTGWRVVTDNHLGDSGTPFGIWVAAFDLAHSASSEGALLLRRIFNTPQSAAPSSSHNMPTEKPLENVTIYQLGQAYIEMKKLLKEEQDGKLAAEVQEWLLRLERGDPEAVEYAEKFSEISLRHIHDVMGRLGIYTEYELGERFFVDSGKKLVDKYASSGIFTRNEDGSVICELDGFEVPMLMLKSNGAALYATTDLGCAVYRAEEWKPDVIVHAVGAEQKFYFEQLFAMEKKIGLAHENVHLWFGTIDQVVEGKREKMSSRKGVVLMEALLDKAEERARAITAGREVSDEDIKKIAVGAIKFTDFQADRKTGILFDWDKIFALSGFSGPFVQYAAVRANKIIAQNADFSAVNYAEYDFLAEKGIIKVLLEYPEVVRAAARGFEAHRVAAYVFRLAQEFNRYYEKVPVSGAEDAMRSARLDLLRKVAQVFSSGLAVLGIEVPEKM
jgi:arginyl-tRNA synthetase